MTLDYYHLVKVPRSKIKGIDESPKISNIAVKINREIKINEYLLKFMLISELKIFKDLI